MIGILGKYEAGSQVFLRVTNFKSLRQVGAYRFEIALQKVGLRMSRRTPRCKLSAPMNKTINRLNVPYLSAIQMT